MLIKVICRSIAENRLNVERRCKKESNEWIGTYEIATIYAREM
jgi:hypothetical protein